ncbi:hypothetical protein GCM10010123_27910 [Pilimelia anulata]|uniref:DUF5941 domain-containing protein n=1 Tax=Pilimelia anulata TaxID=53371 RepID=A0A8J3B872_9ACTN|nr:hypothetical protein GCM10010123_27910 [Pilimelia anulata]
MVGEPRDPDLVGNLRAAGAVDVAVLAPAELPRALVDTVGFDGALVVSGELVASRTVLRHLLTAPGGGAVALTGGPGAGPGLRVERGQVVGLDGPASFLGALRLNPAAARAVAPAQPAATPETLLGDLLAADLPVAAHGVRLLVAGRARDDAAAAGLARQRAGIDEDAAALRLSVKERDDFFTTFAISTWSPHVTRLAARVGLGPSAVTAVSVLLALLAAAAFVRATRLDLVAGGVLLYLSFVLDCVDGQVARYTRRFSRFGGWLDTMADRFKEYVVYGALAWGAQRSGLGDVWPLAIAAMVLQTVRHQTDFWYGALHDAAVRRPRGGPGGALGRMSERVQADAGSAGYWLKRILVFPIGERWALIALAAALFDGRVALLAVLTCGAFAAAYTLTLRSLRARVMRVPVLAGVDLPAVRDEDPPTRRAARGWRPPPLPATAAALLVAAAAVYEVPRVPIWVLLLLVSAAIGLAVCSRARPHDGPLDWLVPAALRGTEYLLLIAAGRAGGVPWPLVFAALLALALRHYDQQTRMEKQAPAAPRARWELPWPTRVVAVAVSAVAPPLAAVVFGLLTADSVVLLGVDVVRSRRAH